MGRELGVPEMLREAEPEELQVGIPAEVLLSGERPLPEATEALIGACFFAFGFERIADAVAAAFEPRIEHAAEHRIDFKSALQELLARRHSTRKLRGDRRIRAVAPPQVRGRRRRRLRAGRRGGGPEQEGGRADRGRAGAETAWGLVMRVASDRDESLGVQG